MTSKTIVLISGANTGIGYEIAKQLALEHADKYHILMGTRSLAKGEAAHKKLGSLENITPIQLDVSSDESIDKAVETITSTYGRLDVLINNAGTAGVDIGVDENWTPPKDKPLRELYTHVYSVNVTSAAIMTEKFTPLLKESSLPKVIFISSGLGSIHAFQNGFPLVPLPWYNSSKTAVNYLSAYYARLYPDWKVNACCPGLVSTGLNYTEESEATHPKNGAINAVRLVLEGKDGATGSYTRKEGPIPW